METQKRTIRNVAAFVGKVVDSTKWNIPNGYFKCEMTGKLFAEADLEHTFNHHFFNREFLVSNHIYCETAAWLSAEGYDIIMAKLEDLGVLEAYREAWEHEGDFMRGRCEIGAKGLVWLDPVPVAPAPAVDDRSWLLLPTKPRPVDPLVAAMYKNTPKCRRCKVMYMPGELNAKKLCRHCADELAFAG